MANRLIYALCCPITGKTRYIGKTTKGLKRPLQHLTNSHSKSVNEWVNDLKLSGNVPQIKILEFVVSSDSLENKESYWINRSISEGDLLLNNLIPLEVVQGNLGSISQFLKDKRKEVNLSQEEFAERAGIALTVIRKIEQGHTNINLDKLLLILEMFGHTIGVTPIK